MSAAAAGRSFPGTCRLRTRIEFEAVLGGGTRQHARGLRMHYRPNALPHARLGVVVPKRVAPRALDRNRIKRIAREAFRACRATLPPVDLVLVASSGAAALERAELRRSCEQLLAKLASN